MNYNRYYLMAVSLSLFLFASLLVATSSILTLAHFFYHGESYFYMIDYTLLLVSLIGSMMNGCYGISNLNSEKLDSKFFNRQSWMGLISLLPFMLLVLTF